MNDMTAAIQPKATELTADDLLTGPRTITITGVTINPSAERPVTISFEGDEGRPFLPCKTVSRILVNAWGPDAKLYVGRSITLYRDPTVKWGGLAVGGLRPSHLSHISAPMTMALTVTKGSKKATTVQPLKVEPPPKSAKAAATSAAKGAASSASGGGTATDGGSPGSGGTTATTSAEDDPAVIEYLSDQLKLQPDLDALVKEWKRLTGDIASLSSSGKATVTGVKDARKAELMDQPK